MVRLILSTAIYIFASLPASAAFPCERLIGKYECSNVATPSPFLLLIYGIELSGQPGFIVQLEHTQNQFLNNGRDYIQSDTPKALQVARGRCIEHEHTLFITEHILDRPSNLQFRLVKRIQSRNEDGSLVEYELQFSSRSGATPWSKPAPEVYFCFRK